MTNPTLYHIKPKNMQGSTLYPLNDLQDIHPDQYEQHRKKYQDREWQRSMRIERLDCFWNDIVFLTAVHPTHLQTALKEAGIETPDREWYAIPYSSLDPEQLAVWLYKLPLDQQDVLEYDPAAHEHYTSIPDATKQYFNQMAEAGKQPLLFHFIPHIFYKGRIDISGLETVHW